jgi:catechol 2,3-dioxygenase
MTEPIRDLAHLSHVELLTPRPDESLEFFREVMGMEVAGECGDSVYLRGFGDYERSSVKLTAAEQSGVGHLAYRTVSPEALARRVAALEAGGVAGSWLDGDLGHGAAYSFHDPDGHRIELFYESERYEAPPELRPALKNQPQRYPGRGIGVRHLDHVNFLAVDPGENRAFHQQHLGLRLTEQIVLDDGAEAGIWLASNQKSYDLTYTRDATGTRGRLHHLAFFVDQREDVLRAADIFLEHGVVMESGPHKHAIQQTFFLYAWEPGGNRVEVCSGGYLIFDPDHQPVVWSQAERARGQAWGMQTVASFHIKGTPPVPLEEELLAGAALGRA